MSLANEAQVQILTADYAGTDAIGKLNAIGAGVTMLGQQPDGSWPPICLAVTVNVPATHAGTDYALSVELHDVTQGKIVQIPTVDGTLQPLRVQQAVTVAPISLPPHLKRPNDALTQHVMVMNFPGGLPLTPGSSYEWRVQIDGRMTHWWSRFHALGPAAGVVFGGPAGPSTIPGVQSSRQDGESQPEA